MTTYIDRIKKRKAELKITNERLSELSGIPLGTLSKLLAGISDSVKLSNMVSICEALGCTLDYIVNGIEENENNYLLDDGEIQLIEDFRALDDHGRELVVLVLNKEKDRVTNETYGIYPARARILERPDVLPDRRVLSLFDLPVSAGPGEFLEGGETETISIPDTPRTRTADFALRISGNSMNPKFKDGDILMVKECDAVEEGELGIFILDNAGYFKVFGGDRLISLNPEYSDILLSSFASVKCCGKVVGKLKRK